MYHIIEHIVMQEKIARRINHNNGITLDNTGYIVNQPHTVMVYSHWLSPGLEPGQEKCRVATL